jgi:hypothetical protein
MFCASFDIVFHIGGCYGIRVDGCFSFGLLRNLF